MKKQVITAMVLLFSIAVFAQKREVRKAENAVEDKDYSEAMSYLKEAEASIGSADQDLKAQFYLVKAEAYQGSAGDDLSKMEMAIKSFEKAKDLGGMNEFGERMTVLKDNLRITLVNSAIKDQNAKKYTVAATKLYNSYRVSPQDTSDLYFAAGNAVNAQDFDTALEYYNELMDLGYTGEVMQYVAVDKETGEEVVYGDKSQRDLMVKAGQVIKPSERMMPSKKGEILRNLTLIYMEKDDDEKAKALMKEARAENPDDISLMQAEANMAYKMGEKEKYNELMQQVAASQPDNPEIMYNLGVATAELGDFEKAKKYYNRVLELKPDYTSALINISVLILNKEREIVDQMNSLGNSRADNEKYDELKEKREQLYRDALPYLEKAEKQKPEDVEIKRTLMNIYSQLGMDAQFKEMKAKVETMEN
ncbi:tetratricopeptide repeat protein [Luteirhabdus pelagi]|uniref:tetratricopeptide repeat protein n=1 Tax=Luteirhabdus pelagi TaxID=2792783 RepID=UPI00193990E7|nr:tetratricopeptide repeat protein [Luteirhabdus pelagi]